MSRTRPKVLALASGGGHWVQLLRLRPAFEGCDVVFATAKEGYRSDVGEAQFRVIVDANRSNKIGLLKSLWSVFMLLRRERPDVVVSTGAAPGFFALRIGKLMGMRTVWVDSIANAEELSMSGAQAGGCADLWLTQWPHLARKEGPTCMGNVL
ncbi:UDP-N-acetylglucosamine--LPS N-acetylglucosamine transferase [Luteolibacter luteus]|uniref:UDP-N-acetylglucosamine--LPS N-acetylglucosamine transferase n=1 Tax=Luteolibacter luteus TaxID=2728835 RepID=A0A858RJM3_9BACT|nr:UDP-N-acetylglucosamine--LPS N-acetylglucosamine transferase [Luteolibacter luteus]QJE97062.1 UDP-N-acetylglucosamine--LPS N-acetylglucosamine transferase [Luteolibacter luteus]